MGGFFNWISNNAQLLIILGFFGISAFGGVVRWLQEQAAKKKAEAQRRRKEENELRTGRPTPSAESQRQAGQRQQDADEGETFAERRRRQIEEMRRRQEAAQRQRQTAQQQGTTGTPAPPPTRTPGPIAMPGPTAGGTRGSRTPQARGQRQQPPARAPSAAERAKVDQPPAEVENLAAEFERRTKQGRGTRATGGVSVSGLRADMDRESLRRAVVLAEILAPPVAIRDDGRKAV